MYGIDPIEILITQTARGFAVGVFLDHYGATCSIQKSSLAGRDCLWLGVDDPDPTDSSTGRMHLTREMAAALIPLLKDFVKTGELREDR